MDPTGPRCESSRPSAVSRWRGVEIEASTIDVIPDLRAVRGDGLYDWYRNEERVCLKCDDGLTYPSVQVDLAHRCTTCETN